MARRRRRGGVRPLWGALPLDREVEQLHPLPGWVVLEEEFRNREHLVPGTDIVLIIHRPYEANSLYGRVLAAHPITLKELGAAVGDTIIYREWSGGRWALNGRKVLITPVEDILAIIL